MDRHFFNSRGDTGVVVAYPVVGEGVGTGMDGSPGDGQARNVLTRSLFRFFSARLVRRETGWVRKVARGGREYRG